MPLGIFQILFMVVPLMPVEYNRASGKANQIKIKRFKNKNLINTYRLIHGSYVGLSFTKENKV